MNANIVIQKVWLLYIEPNLQIYDFHEFFTILAQLQ